MNHIYVRLLLSLEVTEGLFTDQERQEMLMYLCTVSPKWQAIVHFTKWFWMHVLGEGKGGD